MPFLIVILCLCLGGCVTLKEKVSRDAVNACFNLCNHKEGLDSMVIDARFILPGDLDVVATTCVCKNAQAFKISPVYSYKKGQ